ncbi:hypothetical protein BDQ17DRAFT_1382437 [Cyathus striatus]|nr:hypothetical protein BDQ17DRAFT_1382437 [Cyathus striatus]
MNVRTHKQPLHLHIFVFGDIFFYRVSISMCQWIFLRHPGWGRPFGQAAFESGAIAFLWRLVVATTCQSRPA